MSAGAFVETQRALVDDGKKEARLPEVSRGMLRLLIGDMGQLANASVGGSTDDGVEGFRAASLDPVWSEMRVLPSRRRYDGAQVAR